MTMSPTTSRKPYSYEDIGKTKPKLSNLEIHKVIVGVSLLTSTSPAMKLQTLPPNRIVGRAWASRSCDILEITIVVSH